jgi:SnoaL-like domain
MLFETLTAESARTRIMVLVTHQDVTEAAPHLTASGVYHDQWRKTPEEWRLVHRRLHHDTREPLISE